MKGLPRIVVVVALLLALAACLQLPIPGSLAASAGSDRTVETGETVVLDGSASSGEITGYIWTLDSTPVGSTAELAGADTPTATFVPDLPGQYRATLTVTDTRTSASASVLVTAVSAEGILLPGDSQAGAVTATFDLAVPLVLDPRHIEIESDTGEQLLRTEIAIEFMEEVTVGDVNKLLGGLDGVIVVMTRAMVTFVVAIPDPGSAAALSDLLESVRNQETVADAWATYLVPDPPELEADQDLVTLAAPPNPNAAALRHHYAVRAHGAWNAAAAIAEADDRPWLIVADFFGDGTPADGFMGNYTAADFGNDNARDHGYHVLGIIAAAYGGTASTQNRTDVTGIHPEPLRIRVIDLTVPTTGMRLEARLVHLMNQIVNVDSDARIVVNTSLGYVYPPSVRDEERNLSARYYVGMIRRNDLEGRVVHVTSAGNIKCAEPLDDQDRCPNNNWARWPAVDNSVYTFAALGELTSWLGAAIEPLEGILVVENRATLAGGTMQRPTPTCASFGSITGGNISAIGTNVWSMGSGTGAMPLSGTSMASPQTAGLAALIWSLDTSLDASEVTSILLGSARDDYPTSQSGNSGQCAPDAAEPVIDALGAVLAAGGDDARSAMADFDDNGTFDEADIQAFLSAGSSPAALDYGRMDLNGDGITDARPQSGHLDRFDVDGDLALGLYTPDYVDATHSFDEAAMTDLDVLCTLAFSPAYTGSERARNRLLGQPCGFVDINIIDPPEGFRFREGDAISVTADVTLNGRLHGHVSLSTGGNEYARQAYGHQFRGPVSNLTVHHVCASDPFIELAFEDSATGLRAVHRLRVHIIPGMVDVSIAGPDPRFVRVYSPGAGQDPVIDPFDLKGKASNPNCRDPFSNEVDQSVLEWSDDEHGRSLGTGPDITLSGDDLPQEALTGRFLPLEVTLRATVAGVPDVDRTEIRPCTSRLGLSTGQSPVAGYPECPFGSVMGSILEALITIFGTIDQGDIDRIILTNLHGLDVNRAVLDRLGMDPCDPTHCDPFPPGFPMDRTELWDVHRFGDVSFEMGLYLNQLFDFLELADPEDLERQVDELAMAVAANADFSDHDRTLFGVSMGVALATAHFFAPLNDGGEDGWQHFGFAGDPETLHQRVDRLAPARRALEGLLTAIVAPGVREQLDAATYLDAAVYAASLEALEQAQSAAGGMAP